MPSADEPVRRDPERIRADLRASADQFEAIGQDWRADHQRELVNESDESLARREAQLEAAEEQAAEWRAEDAKTPQGRAQARWESEHRRRLTRGEIKANTFTTTAEDRAALRVLNIEPTAEEEADAEPDPEGIKRLGPGDLEHDEYIQAIASAGPRQRRVLTELGLLRAEPRIVGRIGISHRGRTRERRPGTIRTRGSKRNGTRGSPASGSTSSSDPDLPDLPDEHPENRQRSSNELAHRRPMRRR